MDTSILTVSHLTKEFGDYKAVDAISFSIKEGEIVGLLGPNGAGKTTTIQMLLGLLLPTGGSIRYFDRDFKTNKEYCLSHINFASAYSHMQGRMTVRQNLTIFSGLYGIQSPQKRISELVEILGIESTLDQIIWKLSSGQKTRVNLVKSLLNTPKILLMDEPTASLDPEIVDTVLTLIVDLQKKERLSILYTSHNMKEIERICDRVLFLNHGCIVAEDTPLGLSKRVGKATLEITFDSQKDKVAGYLNTSGFTHTFSRNHIVAIQLEEKDIPAVLFGLSKEGVWITNIDIQKPGLEEVFLSIARGDANELAKN